jgi:DUF1365 family protein
MESCIYEGSVMHKRSKPVEHKFAFSLYMLYLDLDELPHVFSGSWLWSTERTAFARFRRRDHLGDPKLPLVDCVRDWVEERIGRRPVGPIRLLTQLRCAGIAMNPVSFYYCFDAEGTRVDTVVAEVNNTPWGERHCYLVASDPDVKDESIRTRTPKQFHVSPFMGMDLAYQWSIQKPGDRIGLRIANHEPDGTLIFEAALGMKRRELSASSRARMLVQYPFITLQLIVAIYWQAFRLYIAGVPIHPHPRNRAEQLEITS